jgi:hypothetical protein
MSRGLADYGNDRSAFQLKLQWSLSRAPSVRGQKKFGVRTAKVLVRGTALSVLGLSGGVKSPVHDAREKALFENRVMRPGCGAVRIEV